MVKVKICGITNLEDAAAAINSGCDALGFVFYKKSSRYVSAEKVRRIIKQLPSRVIKIGIFVNSKEKVIRRIAKLCKLDMLQFHGNESPEFVDRFKDYKVIKAIKVKENISSEAILKYKPFAFLFDTFVPDKSGGTGKKFDWRLVSHINNIKRPVFLSGGLHAKNVKEAICAVKPEWVDVSSSIEIKQGKKSHKKIERFIKAAKNVNKAGVTDVTG